MSGTCMFNEAAEKLDITKKEKVLISQLFQALHVSSHYQLLGVQEDASNKQIRDAYYELSRHWHPDRFFRRNVGSFGPQIEAIFTAVTAAYQTLSDETKRKNYDRKLRKQAKSAAEGSPSRPRRVNIPDPTFAVPDSPETFPHTSQEERDRTEQEKQRCAEAANRAWRVLSRSRRFERNPGRARYRNRILTQIRQGGKENVRRARVYYDAGCAALEAGNPLKAESSLYLAAKLAPENVTYRDQLKTAQSRARELRAKQFISAAESAEQYQNAQEALYNYRRAAEYRTSDSRVYFRLSRLIHIVEKDSREAVKTLRIAIDKAPNNAEYRIALAELYIAQGLKLNAKREYEEAIKIAKDKGLKETRTRAQAGLLALS